MPGRLGSGSLLIYIKQIRCKGGYSEEQIACDYSDGNNTVHWDDGR